MNAFLNMLAGFVGGLGIWLASNSFGASNPSLNGIVYGGFLVVVIILGEIRDELKKRNKE